MSDIGVVEAVCVVHALLPDAGHDGVTAIDKRAVAGPVRVGDYGVRGDVQVDRPGHGGLQKAVYAYADEAASRWAAELDRDLPYGWFGENLRLSGIDVDGAHRGDRWQVGDAERPLEFEVTGARTPCATFARWVGGAEARGWVKRFAAAGNPGAYLRVVTRGTVTAGDRIRVVSTVPDAPTVRDMLAESMRSMG